MQQLVKKLNEMKKLRKMTLKQLAEASGLTLGTVFKIMSGELQKIMPDKLEKLAKALGVSTEYLTSASVPVRSDGYLGLVRIACISPEVKVGNCDFNTQQIIDKAQLACKNGVKIALFPELCITGYTCGDLFFQDALRNSALSNLDRLRSETEDMDMVLIVGLPLIGSFGRLYNVAVVLYRGKILGVVPKKNLPNYNEFMEKRLFCEYSGENTVINVLGEEVPFGVKLVFADSLHPEVRFGVEICEDVWVADSPSIQHSLAGANAVFNLSASNETAVKSQYRKKMIEIQSAKCGLVYAYCSSGMSESTASTVFSAHNIICENGECLDESKPFGNGYAEACVDFDFVENERARLDHSAVPQGYDYIRFEMPLGRAVRQYDAHPFVPKENAHEVYEQILNVLSYGLKKRVEHINASKLVLGVSGGSDSTLALLVCKRALKLLKRPASDILAVTMPCFGTSERTLNNSITLSNALGATLQKIDISASVTQHLKDIGHDMTPDVTFENAQARERTQVLMDLANAHNGLVIGTGDMSESALGWCTYNGDQMSMYNVLSSVPKTLVKKLIAYCADTAQGNLKTVLRDILDTPVSPELLPPDQQGNIAQITENSVGPYELHDYFLYMLVRKGFSPAKVAEMASISFEWTYDKPTIIKWLRFFIKRLFSQQFKRNAVADGVRLGSVDMSKLSLRLPSDADCSVWLAELDVLETIW